MPKASILETSAPKTSTPKVSVPKISAPQKNSPATVQLLSDVRADDLTGPLTKALAKIEATPTIKRLSALRAKRIGDKSPLADAIRRAGKLSGNTRRIYEQALSTRRDTLEKSLDARLQTLLTEAAHA